MKLTREQRLAITIRAEEALNDLRPFLEADGGDISLEEITARRHRPRETARRLQGLRHEPHDDEGRRGGGHQTRRTGDHAPWRP